MLGDAALRDVNRELGLELDEPAEGSTVNALLVELAQGRIPSTGEVFEASDGTRLEVVEASPRRVRRVRVVLALPSVPTSGTRPKSGRERPTRRDSRPP